MNAVRGSLIRVAQNLYEIKQQLPPGKNFGQFVEEEFGMSQSAASKLLSVHRVYILEGGASPETLEQVDAEKLYMSASLEGTVEEKIAKARTLTRSELRQERQEDEPHAFEAKEICKTCGGIRENHA